MMFYVNFNEITVAVDDQFESADLKSLNAFCPRLPWLRIPGSLPGVQ